MAMVEPHQLFVHTLFFPLEYENYDRFCAAKHGTNGSSMQMVTLKMIKRKSLNLRTST